MASISKVWHTVKEVWRQQQGTTMAASELFAPKLGDVHPCQKGHQRTTCKPWSACTGCTMDRAWPDWPSRTSPAETHERAKECIRLHVVSGMHRSIEIPKHAPPPPSPCQTKKKIRKIGAQTEPEGQGSRSTEVGQYHRDSPMRRRTARHGGGIGRTNG